MRRIQAALAVVALGCTDAQLFRYDGASQEADRVTLTGRVCSQDTLQAELPVKVVLVADYAAGPLFSTWDPGGTRVGLLQSFIQSSLSDPDVSFAVVGFAGRSKKLAPTEGNFTRNPGELNAAISTLSIPQPCQGIDQCRDYLEGLRTARAVIEGDIAETPAGVRVLTQYVVLLLIAGMPEPLAMSDECCAPTDADCFDAIPYPDEACQSQRELEEVTEMVAAAARGGALGLKLHVLHLAADAPGPNQSVEGAMKKMVFAGGGFYQQFPLPSTISASDLDLLDVRTALRVKTLVAANINVKPTPTGPAVDSDADGLSDDEESGLGTLATWWDSDDDGLGDLIESLVDFDPLVPDAPTACAGVELDADQDLDGLRDCEELLLGLEPSLVDSDGDGLPDPLEVVSQSDYLHRDAELDPDGDGVTHGEEVTRRTDPRSSDVRAHLNFAYRYELEDEGVSRELFPLRLRYLTGIEVTGMATGSTPGVGRLIYSAVNQTLRWKDALDERPGPAVEIGEGGDLELPSSSWAPVQGDGGRLLRVRVTLADLPPVDTTEDLRVVYRERQCLSYTVRNIKLVDTQMLDDGTGPGLNRIVLFFAETPEGELDRPGPVRLAEIPITFRPPASRSPRASVLEVLEGEFVLPR